MDQQIAFEKQTGSSYIKLYTQEDCDTKGKKQVDKAIDKWIRLCKQQAKGEK